MSEVPLTCEECGRSLAADDQFCPRCGTATPANADPDATLVVERKGASAAAAPADHGPEVTDPAEPPATGFKARLRQVLGAEYEIFSLLGQGGFARVYRARDRRLDRLVAIKVIRPDAAGSQRYVESFRTEGIALAQLRHPGIVPIYDIRERGGLIYYVMPFVQGTTLEARLDRGRLPPFEARRILVEVADALSAVHRANMVHRDIKPANIFLEGDLGKVLLMDFGTAMAVAAEVPEEGEEIVAGTPAYMSPEQAQGLPDIDHRSDIYALGALGYRMLMGRPPFSGKDATAVLQQHIGAPPVPIRDIHPSIPKDFADAIMRCLEKDPWQRFQTAKELGAVLDGVSFFATGRETGAQPAADAAAGPGAPARMLAAAGGLVAGLLIGLLIG